MGDNYVINKVRWMKYSLLCLLICPLSAGANGNGKVVEEKLAVIGRAAPSTNERNEVLNTQQQSKTRTITGTVIDGEDGSPVIGANVVVKNQKTGVITDIDGKFSIVVPEKGTTLEFSYIGYKKQSVVITDQGVVNVTMASDNLLSEVIVVGAGTQKKISVTGAITSVKGTTLSSPSSSLTNNLAGKLAGVISKTTSGEPGSASEFYIRGVGTFGGRATPLIVLDGVEISSGDLNRIPTETIESFSVLKDASATAIYGARGANGVMLVTTKTGTENQKAQINVTVENSFLSPMNQIDYVDGPTWMEMYNEARTTRNPSLGPRYSQEDIDMTRSGVAPYRYPNVDWMDLMFRDMNMNQRANINISGGASRVTYYMSLQVNHDTGMLDIPKTYSFNNNINQWNYVFQNNIGYRITNSTKLTLRMNSQFGNLQGPNRPVKDMFNMAYNTNPINFPATYPSAEGGHVNFGSAYLSGSRQYNNPYAWMLQTYKEENYNTLNTSMNLEQSLDFITKGLKVTALVNFKNYSKVEYDRWLDPYFYQIKDGSWNPDNPNTFELQRVGTSGADYIGQSGARGENDATFYLDARLDYNHSFGRHSVSAMLMYMQRENRKDVLPNRNQGVSGRFTYDYDHKYLAELNFGYNGTERLAKGERFEFFPAMSLGWVISSEPFWEPMEKYINHLKIRGSYGLVGSDDTGGKDSPHFLYVENVTLSGGGYKTGEIGNVEKYGPGFNGYAVQGACWERAKKLDIGIDLELFHQVNITADYFYDKRDRILLQRGSWPRLLGYFGATPWSNIGKVDNKGVEFSVNWSKEIVKDLRMDLRANFTYNKNKYVLKDEPAYSFVWKTDTGKPINITKGLIAEGLFASQEEVDNSPVQSFGSKVMPGDIKYRDVNGDGVINGEDEVMISPYGGTPRLQYGVGLNLTYKKLDFGVFFNGSGKRTIMATGIAPFYTSIDYGDRNIMKFIGDDYWTLENPNPNAAYPRLGLTGADFDNNNRNSTFWMHDGRFIRFKTLEVGYTLANVRVYFSGDNLAVWSPFKLWDPELAWYDYPLQRTLNIGAQIKF